MCSSSLTNKEGKEEDGKKTEGKKEKKMFMTEYGAPSS